MGQSCTQSSEVDFRVLMFGLDASGKTAILSKLGNEVATTPTIGFNVEQKNLKKFTMWDVGGKNQVPNWPHDFQNTKDVHTSGVIFVVDSNDRDRVNQARDELQKMLAEDELRNAVLLVFANKQDLPNAMSTTDVTEKLGLHSLRQRNWFIQGCCATTAQGLYEGLDWLSANIKKSKA